MKNRLLNMVMALNEKGEVAVLDKIIKYGWEGLTFPGGKVEPTESIYESAKRELFEESGLIAKSLTFMGMVTWVDYSNGLFRDVGFLYFTDDFEGELKEECDEGKLYWIDFDDFLKMENKSDSMDYILKVYTGECSEVLIEYEEDQLQKVYFYGEKR